MPTHSIHVYIVDDEPSIRTAYSRLVRSAEMEPHAFASVEDLMQFLESALPNSRACVVSDIRMPGTSGLRLPSLLDHAGMNLPVIFATAHDTPESREAAQEMGAAGFFRKPVDDQALLDAIVWALGAGRKSG